MIAIMWHAQANNGRNEVHTMHIHDHITNVSGGHFE